jgi:hypothetical protein
MMTRPVAPPSARAAVTAVERFGTVLPSLVLRPVPVFAPAAPVLRQVHGQGQLNLDLRPR